MFLKFHLMRFFFATTLRRPPTKYLQLLCILNRPRGIITIVNSTLTKMFYRWSFRKIFIQLIPTSFLNYPLQRPRVFSFIWSRPMSQKSDVVAPYPTMYCTNSILFVDFRFQNRNVHGSNVVCSSLVKRCVPARYQMRELEHWKLVAIGNEISDNRWLCAGQFISTYLIFYSPPPSLSRFLSSIPLLVLEFTTLFARCVSRR